MVEVLEPKIADDIQKNNAQVALLDLKDYADSHTGEEAKQQIALVSDAMVKAELLPGLTIVGVDNDIEDGNGTGLIVKDTLGNKDGETYTLDPNTGIATDKQGRVQAIYYPDGSVQRFEYKGDTSELVEVTDTKGVVYVKGDDNKWSIKNADGTTTATDMTFDVNSFGDVTISGKGTKEVHRVDGSATYFDTTSGKDVVTRTVSPYDPNNNNLRISHEIKYGADGKPVGVNITDFDNPSNPNFPQQTWTKGTDGKWTGKIGDKTVTSDAKFEVLPDGSMKITNNGVIETYSANGKSEVTYPDGTVVRRDNGNKPTEIVYPNGKKTTISYDNGRVSSLDINGEKYKLDENGKWTKNGVATDIKVDVHPSGGVELIQTNGARELIKPDGSRVKVDEKGRPTEITPPTGPVQKFTYDMNGLSSFMIGTKTYKREGANSWVSDGEPFVGTVSADPAGNICIETAYTVSYIYTNGQRVDKAKQTTRS